MVVELLIVLMMKVDGSEIGSVFNEMLMLVKRRQ